MDDDSARSQRALVDSHDELADARRRSIEFEQRLNAIRAKLEDCDRRIDSADTITELKAIVDEVSRLEEQAAQLRFLGKGEIGRSLN